MNSKIQEMIDSMPTPTLAEVNALYEEEVARVAAMTPAQLVEDKRRSDARFAKLGLPTLQEYLDLSDADLQVIETRSRPARALKVRRNSVCMTQQQLADKMETDKARVVRAESAAPGVSVDFILRALYTVGATSSDIAEAIAT